MSNEVIFFSAFVVFVILMLFIDLVLISRNSHEIKFKEALAWSGVWISMALIFLGFIWYQGHIIHGITDMESLKRVVEMNSHSITLIPDNFEQSLAIYNHNLALEYLTGYVLEYSLSIDNVFVMIMIFMAFQVKKEYYKKVLFWGIIGAIVMRFLFIFISGSLIHEFEWVMYIFGTFLIFSGTKMFLSRNKDEKIDQEKHPMVRFASKFFSVKPSDSDRFFIKENGKRFVTPLFLVLLVIEFTDVLFAVDSIPAIFSVTQDTYIVFFSNVFAILGLRSLFFLVIHVINLFRYLSYSLSVLLVFIGVKIILHKYMEAWGFTTSHSLIVVFGLIAAGILASVIIPVKKD